MKIVHLVPSMESGGVEQVVLELGKAFSSQGIENVVVSAGGRLVKQLESEGSRHITMPIGKKSLKTLFQVGKLVDLLIRERPDILHIHSRVPGWVGFLACRRLKDEERPSVVTSVHGFYSVNWYSAIMVKGDRVIAVSESAKDYILKNYPKAKEEVIRVIPNSIDPAKYHAGYHPSEEWLAGWLGQYPELEGKYTLCLPGRLTRIKGQLDLIPILKGLIERGIPAHAVIVGEAKKSKQAYRDELADAFDKAGLSAHVSWTGHRTDLSDIQAYCDVTLSLTKMPESFGKTTLESLALGKPVAGYAHGGVEEQLKVIFPDGLIAVNDTDAMIEKLASWYQSMPSVPGTIPAEYRIDGMISSHLELYNELINRL